MTCCFLIYSVEIYSLRVVPKLLAGKPEGWNSELFNQTKCRCYMSGACALLIGVLIWKSVCNWFTLFTCDQFKLNLILVINNNTSYINPSFRYRESGFSSTKKQHLLSQRLHIIFLRCCVSLDAWTDMKHWCLRRKSNLTWWLHIYQENKMLQVQTGVIHMPLKWRKWDHFMPMRFGYTNRLSDKILLL